MFAGWALVAVLAVDRTAAAADLAGTAPPIQRPRAWVGPLEPEVVTPAPISSESPASPTRAPAIAAPSTPTVPAAATAPWAPTLPAAASDDPTLAQPVASASPPRPAAAHGNEPALHRRAPDHMRTFSHRGFTTDLRIGTIGCLRGACGADRHAANAGFRIDGFIGGNIRGWVDLGIAGGWGAMSSDVKPGTNVLALYGLDPAQLQTALGLLAGQALGIDLGSLAVNDARLRTAQAGPVVRVHFIPRGRFAAYVGTGVQYNLFRARYGTSSGPAQLDFHGLAVPIEGGFGVHVLEHLALGVQFDYLWTWYAIANLEQGATSLPVPVRVLDQAAKMQNGGSFRDQLPQFWTFALTLRARI
jgi:hypothetical protein